MFRAAQPSIMLSGLIFATAAAVMLGWYVPQFTVEHGLPILDLTGWHTPQDTLLLMARYTPAARRAYLVFLALDCLFPVAGSWFVVAVVRAALVSFDREATALRHAVLFPIAAALCDLLENACHALLTIRYPADAQLLASVAWAFTSAKFLFLIGNYSVFLIALSALTAKQVARLKPSGS